MGTLPRLAVLSTLTIVSTLGILPSNAVSAQTDDDPAAVGAAMLDDVGAGFVLTDESSENGGALTRTFEGPSGTVQITGFSVTTPPGVAQLFEATPVIDGFEFVDEPSLELARWMVTDGTSPGDGGVSLLNVASRDHIFTIALFLADGATGDGPAFVLDLARRQVEAAGAPEVGAEPVPRAVDDDDLLQFLPAQPPPGFGLGSESLTISGAEEFDAAGLSDPEVVEFIVDRSKNVARVWIGEQLTLGIGISQYPYDIFAASGLTAFDDMQQLAVDPTTATLPANAVFFRDDDTPQVTMVFRRGDILVTVLAGFTDPALEPTAGALALDAANLVASRLPPGGTSPYVFPDLPSRFAGLALTGGVVLAAVAGARLVARVRARRIRRRWRADPSSDAWPPPSPAGTVVRLDDDAADLRRRGAVVAGVQLLTILTGVVALSGDFAWRGVFVAAASLVVGLSFSRWWLRREHALLGPSAPPKAFRVPRVSGAIMGVTAFAVLGVGVAYFLKGVRYVILKPTLAQLRWSDLLGLAPRTVGIVFAIGGLLMVALGAALWRIARALGRARVKEVLRFDPRPPVLYLRSFDDDAVPLPIIASARRPLFEFFSIRGADPFEECVAWELDSYGPVIAVGRPGASLASLGAAREHLSDDTWRDEVAARMNSAGWIVLAPGETAGLAWELQSIVSGGHLAKTVFVFPPLAPSELERRWEHTARVLREMGASVGPLPVPHRCVHTAQLGRDECVRATSASTRDEATYRTAVDRALSSWTEVDMPLVTVRT